MNYISKVFLFLTPLLIATLSVVVYFKLTDKILGITLPSIPSVTFSDLVKFSRFSLDKAPSASLVGDIVSMTGETMFQGRMATESAKLNSLQKIQQGEDLFTGDDGNITLVFSEACQLNILPNSSVGIIQTLPANLVFLQKKGVAQYSKVGSTPISIRSHHLLIENEGDISVSVDPDKKIIKVDVSSGKIKIAYNNINNDTKYLEVESGTKITFNDGTRQVVLE